MLFDYKAEPKMEIDVLLLFLIYNVVESLHY